MPEPRRQFVILFRQFLSRIVDTELLSSGGDPGKLLGQVAALLAAFSLTFVIVNAPKYFTSGLQGELVAAVHAETAFLLATTTAIAGLLSVLMWNAVLPDRRDCAILGVLPVRLPVLFLAKVTAIGAVLLTAVVATNLFTGLCYPFLAPAGGPLRSLMVFWLAMFGNAIFVCCAMLATQGIAGMVLRPRQISRISSWIQFALFFAIVATYILKPSILSRTPPWRAMAGCAMLAAVSFPLAFRRAMRRIMEQPDIEPGDRARWAARTMRLLVRLLFPKPLDRAIVLFTARTLARSRQHRLLLAGYGGAGLAISLVYARDLLYGYSGSLWDSLGVDRTSSAHWNQANIPLLAGSVVLLCFAILGARATFSMPIALPANWVFRITAVHEPAAYFAAVRKALFVLAAVPIWIAAALVFFAIWPAPQALQHLAVLMSVGILLVEISLYRFRKIPFACSYLPGKSNLNVRIGVYGVAFLLAADRGVAIEYWAMQHALGFVALVGVLLAVAMWARRRTRAFSAMCRNGIQFEEVQEADVFALDLRQDGAWSCDDAYVNAIDPHFGRKLAEWAEGGAGRPAIAKSPPWTVRALWEGLLRDLRQAGQVFRNAPGFSAATVFLIAMAIGGNLTIYSIVRSVLAKPAPGVQGGGLVTFGTKIDGRLAEGGPLNSYPNYLDLAAQSKTMSAMAASAAAPWLTVSLPDGSYEMRGEMVSANYFATLGIPLARGRTFTDEEARGDGGLAAILAYHVWQAQFHGAEDAIGRRIVVNGHAAKVIGVTARGFHGAGLTPHFEIGLPIVGFSRIRGSDAELFDRSWRGVTISGRLARGANLAQAESEFTILSARMAARHRDENQGWAVVLAPYAATAFGPNSSPQVRRVMTGVSLVGLLGLLVVCGNVAALMLSRAAAREREMAIRLSMGASGLDIVRMLLAEGLALSATACAGAWILARWVTGIAGKLAPPLESGAHLRLDLAPDGHVLIYAMILAVLSAAAFTLVPAAGFARRRISPILKAAEHSVTRGRFRFANRLVLVQLAICVVLLTAGTLAYRSLFFIDTTDLYFTKGHLLLASVNTGGAASGGVENQALLERIRQRLRAVPGVTSVSYATAAPPHDHGWMELPVQAVGSLNSTVTDGTTVGPDYIAALGVPQLVGRDISAADVNGGRPAAVINRKLAAALWPGQQALGQSFVMNGGDPVEVVGVVPNGAFSGVAKDGSFAGMGKAERPNFVFLSQPGMGTPGAKTFHIRYASNLTRIIPEIRAAVREVDGRVPVFSVRTMAAEFAEFTAPIRIVTKLIGVFALAALLLSAVGLYAVIAFHTSQRRREFGIRSALGATPGRIVQAVLREAFALSAAGIAIGLTIARAGAKSAAGLLFGVSPTDGVTYVCVALVLITISLIACCVPAWRASRVDPMTALRQD